MMRVHWVKIWIDPMAALTERFRKEDGSIDFEALGREEYEFRHALIVGDFAKSARAKEAADQAAKDFKYHSENGKKGGRPAKKLSADATTREDVVNVPDGSDAAKMESRPSAESLPVAKNPKSGYGEFTNVMLTDDEFAKWMASGTDAAELIEELSSYLASSGKRYKSHYATLVNWRKRKSKEKKDAPKSFAQQDAERREYQLTHSILDKVAL